MPICVNVRDLGDGSIVCDNHRSSDSSVNGGVEARAVDGAASDGLDNPLYQGSRLH